MIKSSACHAQLRWLPRSLAYLEPKPCNWATSLSEGQRAGQVAFTASSERPQYEASIEEGREEEEEEEEVVVEEEYGEAEEEIRFAIARMYVAQPSSALVRYFTTLQDENRAWNEETLITGIRDFAAIAGYQRAEYFENPWSGLQYPTEVEELWRQTHPCLSRAARDESVGWICPPTWSHTFENAMCTITYCGSAPFSQGLNELATGPTSLDCGMFCQVLIWMGLRYMTGDGIFDRAFDVTIRQLTIVQSWCKSGPEGNSLYPSITDGPILAHASRPAYSTAIHLICRSIPEGSTGCRTRLRWMMSISYFTQAPLTNRSHPMEFTKTRRGIQYSQRFRGCGSHGAVEALSKLHPPNARSKILGRHA